MSWEAFERDIETLAQADGWSVLPSRKFSDDHGSEVAPMLESDDGNTILPDVYVMNEGRHRWAECKLKSEPLYYTKGGYYEHGIDAPNWFDYHKIQNVTGDDVYIFIYEDNSKKLLAQEIDSLDLCGGYATDDYQGSAAKYPNEMVFFKREDFRIVDIPVSFGELDLEYQSSTSLSKDAFSLFGDDNSNNNSQSDLSEF